MSDAINRQDAIDVARKCHVKEVTPAYMLIDKSEIMTELMLMPSAEPEPHWIPCSERLPDEDHWLGGSGKQFSDNVLISIVNCNDEDAWVQVSQTIDGTWALELPRYCKVLAWMPLPSPYQPEEGRK